VKIDFSTPPAEVYKQIAALDEDGFEDLMDDPKARPKVIDALVAHMTEQFDPARAGDLDAVIHVKLWDRPGGGYDHRELVIRDGICTQSDAPSPEPDLTLKVRPTDLRKIVTGETGPTRLALRGRLRVLGDLGLGRRLGELFDFG
jgi:putative sterol carrier protein